MLPIIRRLITLVCFTLCLVISLSLNFSPPPLLSSSLPECIPLGINETHSHTEQSKERNERKKKEKARVPVKDRIKGLKGIWERSGETRRAVSGSCRGLEVGLFVLPHVSTRPPPFLSRQCGSHSPPGSRLHPVNSTSTGHLRPTPCEPAPCPPPPRCNKKKRQYVNVMKGAN